MARRYKNRMRLENINMAEGRFLLEGDDRLWALLSSWNQPVPGMSNDLYIYVIGGKEQKILPKSAVVTEVRDKPFPKGCKPQE